MTLPWRRYLLWFAQEHVDFRFQELNSLISMFNLPMKFVEQPTPLQPYWIVEMQNDQDVKLLASRSVSIRSCMELWGHSKTIESLHEKLKFVPENLSRGYLEPHQTFKIEVETFCKHFTQKEKVEKIEMFSYIPFQGQVKLNDPDVCFQYIEYYGVDSKCPPSVPEDVFFGRWIANGLRKIIKKLSLKTRKFIGNTSMDAQLSLLMANQAQVKPGDLVLDPFVGSGSLLVAAAQFGGYVVGTDIDYLMLHARNKPSRITQQIREQDEGVKANMQQYGLEDKYLDVLVNDFSSVFWRSDLKFDCIITDPPYGIREATEKIGTSKDKAEVKEEHLATHYPAKVEYGIAKIYFDLLTFCTEHLNVGGRLVCWFPIYREDYSEDALPSHPCLRLLANSEQLLSKYTSRRLLTYEKVCEPDPSQSTNNGSNIQDFREKFFGLRDETRKERRMKKAVLKEQGRIEAEKRRGKKD